MACELITVENPLSEEDLSSIPDDPRSLGGTFFPPTYPAEKASECEFCDGLGHEAQKKCAHCDGSGLNGEESQNA